MYYLQHCYILHMKWYDTRTYIYVNNTDFTQIKCYSDLTKTESQKYDF